MPQPELLPHDDLPQQMRRQHHVLVEDVMGKHSEMTLLAQAID